ncbi:MAG TPA: hypothetical protein PKJ75_03030, partial [Methanosarcina vacuolata]|nr:hypothetical protein [Methanosarcina vacuolata]
SNARRDSYEPINLTLSANYGNGINKHENIVSNMYIQSIDEIQGGSSGILVPGLLLVVIAIAGMLVYRKKKQNRK